MSTPSTWITKMLRVVTQTSKPTTPITGFGLFYDKNKIPYFLNSDGVEISLVGGGGGCPQDGFSGKGGNGVVMIRIQVGV